MTILIDSDSKWNWLPTFSVGFADYQEEQSWYNRDVDISFGWGSLALTIMTYSHARVYNGLLDMINCLVNYDEDKYERLMKVFDKPDECQYTQEEFTRIVQGIRDN